MVYAALAEDDAALAAAPYKVLENWHQDYDGNLRIILPDTYGTKGFLEARARRGSPPGPASASTPACRRRGRRPPSPGGRARARTRAQKLVIFSDGLDVDRIEALYHRFHGRVGVSFGWGTLLTNDFRGLAPRRRAGAVQPGLQGGQRQRPADGQALGQPRQGARPGGRGRALQAGVRGRRAGRGAGAGVSRRVPCRDAPRHATVALMLGAAITRSVLPALGRGVLLALVVLAPLILGLLAVETEPRVRDAGPPDAAAASRTRDVAAGLRELCGGAAGDVARARGRDQRRPRVGAAAGARARGRGARWGRRGAAARGSRSARRMLPGGLWLNLEGAVAPSEDGVERRLGAGRAAARCRRRWRSPRRGWVSTAALGDGLGSAALRQRRADRGWRRRG